MSKMRCSRCGYDLREHELHERCSECGAEVTLAYSEHPLWSGDLQVILRRGLWWITGGLLLLPLPIAAACLMFFNNPLHIPIADPVPTCLVVAAIQQVFWMRGTILVTHCNHHALARTRVLVRGAAYLMPVAMILLIVLPGIDFNSLTAYYWESIFGAAGLLALSLAVGLLAVWFARLSKWMGTVHFTWQLQVIAVLILLPIVASGAVAITMALERTDWIDGLYYGMIVAIFGTLSTGTLGTVWLLIVCVLWGRELHKENIALGLAR